MINNMTVQELKEKLEKNEELILIDCREQNEWDDGHIEEADLIPLSNFAELAKKLDENDNKKKVIVCQCRSGKRSLAAAGILESNGYEELYNLEGGIMAWAESGYPIKK